MVVGIVKIKIYTPWVHSLKEKRMVVKSICAKVRNNFNTSIAEVEEQDTHQTIVLGFSSVTDHTAQADSILDHIIRYIENNTEGEVFILDREII